MALFRRAYSLVPFVVERTGSGERTFDIYSRLLKDRIVCLHDAVDQRTASSIVAQLLFLEASDAHKPIHLYINSPGGNVSDGLAIYDTIQYIAAPVHTVCMGMAASMSALILAGGAKGHRYALPNSLVLVHQPHGGAQGQATDIAIQAQEILKVRGQLNGLFARHTGRGLAEIETTMERDKFMSPEEARAFGIVDVVLSKREPAPA